MSATFTPLSNAECAALLSLAIPFRAGDTVHHSPSGEDWLLAVDEERGRVQPAGWPCSMAEAADCHLIKAASDEERLAMLTECMAMRDDRDPRCTTARRQLSATSRRLHALA